MIMEDDSLINTERLVNLEPFLVDVPGLLGFPFPDASCHVPNPSEHPKAERASWLLRDQPATQRDLFSSPPSGLSGNNNLRPDVTEAPDSLLLAWQATADVPSAAALDAAFTDADAAMLNILLGGDDTLGTPGAQSAAAWAQASVPTQAPTPPPMHYQPPQPLPSWQAPLNGAGSWPARAPHAHPPAPPTPASPPLLALAYSWDGAAQAPPPRAYTGLQPPSPSLQHADAAGGAAPPHAALRHHPATQPRPAPPPQQQQQQRSAARSPQPPTPNGAGAGALAASCRHGVVALPRPSPSGNRWGAILRLGRERLAIGSFPTEVAAAQGHDIVLLQLRAAGEAAVAGLQRVMREHAAADAAAAAQATPGGAQAAAAAAESAPPTSPAVARKRGAPFAGGGGGASAAGRPSDDGEGARGESKSPRLTGGAATAGATVAGAAGAAAAAATAPLLPACKLPVVCGSLRGVFDTHSLLFTLAGGGGGTPRGGEGKGITGTEFERRAGHGSRKKWRNSVFVCAEAGGEPLEPLGAWLERHEREAAARAAAADDGGGGADAAADAAAAAPISPTLAADLLAAAPLNFPGATYPAVAVRHVLSRLQSPLLLQLLVGEEAAAARMRSLPRARILYGAASAAGEGAAGRAPPPPLAVQTPAAMLSGAALRGARSPSLAGPFDALAVNPRSGLDSLALPPPQAPPPSAARDPGGDAGPSTAAAPPDAGVLIDGGGGGGGGGGDEWGRLGSVVAPLWLEAEPPLLGAAGPGAFL